MPSVPLHFPHAKSVEPINNVLTNPLPHLFQTPSGLALLELQGTINMPAIDPTEEPHDALAQETPIGRIVFPDYSTDTAPESTAWMKNVYLYIGMHQRLTGEVKKLPRPVAVIRRKVGPEGSELVGEELEIVEVVYYKILFSSRPEPVGS
ncbi:hypothetical protein MMC12_003947 [Toensbergia leucococca]|nr:hypothetical protein [Toensbergia leucococca]